MLADQAAADGGEEKKEESKPEPVIDAEHVDGEGEDGDAKSRASAKSAAKQKRPATDKQTAYLEYARMDFKSLLREEDVSTWQTSTALISPA